MPMLRIECVSILHIVNGLFFTHIYKLLGLLSLLIQ